MKLYKRILGEGKPIVILHGLFGSSDNWQTFGRKLSEQGFRVILADLRNHGQSPHSDEMNFKVMAEDIKELLDDEGLPSAFLAGHSLGGKTAMKFAFMYPEMISKLVVIDIAPRAYPVHHQGIIESLQKVDTNSLKTRAEAESQLAIGIEDSSTQQFLLKNLYRKEKDLFAWRFNLDAIKKQIENVGEATYPSSPFDKPTLFIRGEKSIYINYDDEREIYDHFLNVVVKAAPTSGHWVHADNPEWLLGEFLNFTK